jgi:hypothetical protein
MLAAVTAQPAVAARGRDWSAEWGTMILLGAVCTIIFAVIWAVFDRLLRHAQSQDRRTRTEPTAGEAASAAIEIAATDQAAAAGARVPCACGGRLTKSETSTLEASRLGDDLVHSARFTCDRCARSRALYFRLKTSG